MPVLLKHLAHLPVQVGCHCRAFRWILSQWSRINHFCWMLRNSLTGKPDFASVLNTKQAICLPLRFDHRWFKELLLLHKTSNKFNLLPMFLRVTLPLGKLLGRLSHSQPSILRMIIIIITCFFSSHACMTCMDNSFVGGSFIACSYMGHIPLHTSLFQTLSS